MKQRPNPVTVLVILAVLVTLAGQLWQTWYISDLYRQIGALKGARVVVVEQKGGE